MSTVLAQRLVTLNERAIVPCSWQTTSIQWAGPETADISRGDLDGAIQSDKRVADTCIKRLTPWVE